MSKDFQLYGLLRRIADKNAYLVLEDNQVILRGNTNAVDKELLAELRSAKEELRVFLNVKKMRPRKKLTARARPDRLPLSYGQSRLWFLHQLDRESTEYNVPLALRLVGALDVAALERSLQTLVLRHESLRTHFEEHDGQPVQVIAPAVALALAVEDLSDLEESERASRVADALARERRVPFDLGRGPVLRVRLLKLSEGEHVFLRTMHHIVSDGWSQGVFNRELTVLYEAYRSGRENPLPALRVQYADFALWQRAWLEGGALEEGLAYWRQQLDGIPEQLQLPTDRPRPAVQTHRAEMHTVAVPEELAAGLKRLSSASGATLHMTLLSAFGVLLSRYSGQEDIVVGSPIANRQDAQLEDLIGFFVNTLVMRLRVEGSLSFEELLQQVRQTALDAYQHQDVPFERLVEELAPERSLSRSPIFQTVFSLQHRAPVLHELDELKQQPISGTGIATRFDMRVSVVDYGYGLHVSWTYRCDLFDSWRIEQMASHYVRILEVMNASPQLQIRNLELLDRAERNRLLEWAGSGELV